MERETGHNAQASTQFLAEAQVDGAIARFRNKNRNRPNTTRDLNILAIYRGTYLNKFDLARQYGLTRERVRQVLRRTSVGIWRQASDELREKYPRDSVDLTRDSKENNRKKASTNLATRIQSMEAEDLPLKTILMQLNITHTQFRGIKRAVNAAEKSRKHEISQAKKGKQTELLNTIRQSQDRVEVKKALDSLSQSALFRLAHLETSPIVPLSTFFDLKPTRNGAKSIYFILRAQDFPVRRVRQNRPKQRICYYFSVDRFRQAALDALEEEDALELVTSKVTQVCGPSAQLPATTEFSRPTSYIRVFSNEFKRRIAPVRLKKMGLTHRDILTGCPVPVFGYQKGFGSYITKTADITKLQQFLNTRLQELGL